MTYSLDFTTDALETARGFRRRALEAAAMATCANTASYYTAKAEAHLRQIDNLLAADIDEEPRRCGQD